MVTVMPLGVNVNADGSNKPGVCNVLPIWPISDSNFCTAEFRRSAFTNSPSMKIGLSMLRGPQARIYCRIREIGRRQQRFRVVGVGIDVDAQARPTAFQVGTCHPACPQVVDRSDD